MRRFLAQVVLSCVLLSPVLGCDKEYKKPENAPDKVKEGAQEQKVKKKVDMPQK
jgi:hypothetical protein